MIKIKKLNKDIIKKSILGILKTELKPTFILNTEHSVCIVHQNS